MKDDLGPDAVREAFKRRRGHWNDDWEAMLAFSPAYVAAYLDFSAYVAERGTLSPKFREFVYVATNCTPTHMFEKGLRNHARQAMALGATPAELCSVVATVSAMGIASYLLIAESVAALAAGRAVNADRNAIDRVKVDNAAWFGDTMARTGAQIERAGIELDSDFYACWLDFAAAPVRGPKAALSIKDAHLIALAVHAQCTQLNPAGVRQHAAAALAHGATADEVLDIGRLISSMGIHAMVFALPVISDLVARRDEHGDFPRL